jgi:redox-sensing transcriptional repressor
VRKDLSYFGQFGIPGVGYNVAELRSGLARIMGLQDAKKVILVGAGSLGSALCRYQGFREEGFDICAIFDSDHAKVGQRLGKVQIQHISELTSTNRELKADMALIAVPAYASQAVANLLVEAGIDSIVTFAPTAIEVASNVLVRRVDLTKELAVLSCYTELRDEVPNVSTPD